MRVWKRPAVAAKALSAAAVGIALLAAHPSLAATIDFTVTQGKNGVNVFTGTLEGTDDGTTGTFDSVSYWAGNGESGYSATNVTGTYSVTGGVATIGAFAFDYGASPNIGQLNFANSNNDSVQIDGSGIWNNFCQGASCKFGSITTTSFSSVLAGGTTFNASSGGTVGAPEIDGAGLPMALLVLGLGAVLFTSNRRRETGASLAAC